MKKGYEVAAKIAKSKGLKVNDGTKINIDSSIGSDGMKIAITAENKETDGGYTVDKLEFKPGVDGVDIATAPIAIGVGTAISIGQLTDTITAREAYMFTQLAF